jgi:hypothetical protein
VNVIAPLALKRGRCFAGRHPGSRRRSRSRHAQSRYPSAPDHSGCKDRLAAAPICTILETRPKKS